MAADTGSTPVASALERPGILRLVARSDEASEELKMLRTVLRTRGPSEQP
jgi:hypothetical protein